MALTVSISVAQNTGTPSQFVISDTSTGSDPSITERRVYLYDSQNNTLVNSGTTTAYTLWPIASSSITMDVLNRDMALEIIVQWVAGSTVVYTYTNEYDFDAYTNVFGYNLTVTNQLSNPAIINSTNYFSNKSLLYEFIDDADISVSVGQDIVKAQFALDSAYNLIINTNLYF